ncbi:MAG: hypothetical protein CO092_04610 [Candidatus Aenigmarchaeota archaeon CG_4_9_14_3_um_filter_37_18]|nr:MAG: hypothetical protein COW21_00225 [Candidatus Aenigmarchaeota archaeon CG15_BIG_FIL_POST_REV_8_21_14_020_37_27]PJB74409.1 MAG: hypothetical protein CO092_04610 [Candidatus Aenigmarchaeota archaeon CG_4_9_14_3_um_filter_37_18]
MDVLLEKLVKIKSISGEEENISNFIFDYLKDQGLTPIKQDGNVILHIKGNQNKALIFDAHIDTVEAGNVNKWEFPPSGQYSGKIKNGKLYGLGSSDNKSSVAVLMKLCKWVKENNPKWDVWFAFVVKEEVDGYGSKSFIKWLKSQYLEKYDDIQCVVCEPRGCKEVGLGNKGNIFVKIKIQGESGHSAKINEIEKQAILEGVKVIKKLNEIENKLKKKYFDSDLGFTTIAITGFEAVESSPNKIPGTCLISLDIRTIPETHEKIIDIIKDELMNFNLKFEWTYHSTQPVKTSKNSGIVKILKKIDPELKITYSSTNNDSCYFIKENIPTVVFGPGNKEQSHKENEFVNLKNLPICLGIFKKLVKGVEND